MRVAYLGGLWIVAFTAWLSTGQWQRVATLGETARLGPLLFQILSMVQLTFLLFFSALSAASAVSQEKDRRTFILLLITDMRDREIVLGKIFGSLLPIVFLLAGSLPLLSSLLLLGGVAPFQVIEAMAILASTALAAGSLGGLVALWREKTFPALALTTLFLVLFLGLTQSIAFIPGINPQQALQLRFMLVGECSCFVSGTPVGNQLCNAKHRKTLAPRKKTAPLPMLHPGQPGMCMATLFFGVRFLPALMAGDL
jgi:hypothetical protein